ncbi:MAG: isocitrate lyase/phosphoenolpyruvate mutase family protein, partial [Dehalococcoidia bacterium]
MTGGGRRDLARQADRLRVLHYGDTPLVLPNVGDAASAKLAAEAGFPALATGSASVAAAIRELVTGIKGPVNVLYRPGSPSLQELAEHGVARVTFGPGLHRAAMGAMSDLLTGLFKG